MTQKQISATGHITEETAQKLILQYGITAEDLERIRSYGKTIVPKLDELVGLFYVWLEKQPEYDEFLSDPETLARARSGQIIYWKAFFTSSIDKNYLETRAHVGETHARIGLPLPIYFAGYNTFHRVILEDLYDGRLSDAKRLEVVRSVTKLMHLDTSVIVETYQRMTNEAMSAQSRSLMQLSTPVTQIWEGVLFLPIVGIVDSKRAQEIMNATLSKISEARARAFIMDISGVAVVDTAVANYLIKVTRATRLMGCDTTISGVSPAIAQTIVELGIEVGKVKTTATMQDALSDAFRVLGSEIRKGRPGHG